MANKAEMELKDFVEAEAPGFGPGSRASEQVLQEDVDKAAERFKTIKDAKNALRKYKIKTISKAFEKATPSQLIGTSGYEKALANEIAGGMKRGGSVMSRGCKMGRNKPTKLY